MECLNYPFEPGTLLAKKIRLKKQMKAEIVNLIHKNIAVLGGSTTNEVVDQLELFLLNQGISAEFYQSEYAQYWEDAVFGNETLDDFKTDIIYIHTSWRNINTFPNVGDTADKIEDILNEEYNRFVTMWDALERKFHCPIIQNNFDRPNYRLLGNRDIWDIQGRSNFISRLNQKFYNYAREHKGFYINDLDFLAADFGLAAWQDVSCWHLYKYAMSLKAIPSVANSVANIIKAIYGKNKKALALDLDNTLWGGVVSDDGVEGIAVGPELPEGQVYSEFQSYCKDLKSIGVILTVDSKNDESNALAGLNHPDAVLKPDDFVMIKANWSPKHENLVETATELNIGVDSFVFVDDNPAEREIVRTNIPGVGVPEVGQVESFISIIDRSGFFETVDISNEDLKKTEMYAANAKREQAKLNFTDYGQYLDNLNMTGIIKPFEPMYMERIAQLTNKSNQFNLTTFRCSVDDVTGMASDGEHITLAGRLNDKFGENGLVAVSAGRITDDNLDIILWLMSCRVLKRGFENAMMNELVAQCRKKNIKRIIGHYYPTAKNAMVKNFYAEMGFKKINEDSAGNIEWVLGVDEFKPFDVHMTVER